MALSDVVAPNVTTKFNYHFWRPATAIQEADPDGNPDTDADPTWAPRAGGIGASPEYTSGHSWFAGAATTILRGMFESDSALNGPRSYQSFSHAETEVEPARLEGEQARDAEIEARPDEHLLARSQLGLVHGVKAAATDAVKRAEKGDSGRGAVNSLPANPRDYRPTEI